jgi:hypothetical protein
LFASGANGTTLGHYASTCGQGTTEITVYVNGQVEQSYYFDSYASVTKSAHVYGAECNPGIVVFRADKEIINAGEEVTITPYFKLDEFDENSPLVKFSPVQEFDVSVFQLAGSAYIEDANGMFGSELENIKMPIKLIAGEGFTGGGTEVFITRTLNKKKLIKEIENPEFYYPPVINQSAGINSLNVESRVNSANSFTLPNYLSSAIKGCTDKLVVKKPEDECEEPTEICDENWEPTQITEDNFKVKKEGDEWSWIDKDGYARTEQISIPDEHCNGLEALTYIAKDINSQYNLFDDTYISVCKNGDKWNFNLSNLRIPIVYGNCLKADGESKVDLNTAGNEDKFNSYINNCEKFKYLKRLLEFYRIGRYTPRDTLLPFDINPGLPYFISEEGALKHEIVHTGQLINEGLKELNKVLQRFYNYKSGAECPEDVKVQLNYMLFNNFKIYLIKASDNIYEATKFHEEKRKLNYDVVEQFLSPDFPDRYVYLIPIAELEADKNATDTYDTILNEFINWGEHNSFNLCN